MSHSKASSGAIALLLSLMIPCAAAAGPSVPAAFLPPAEPAARPAPRLLLEAMAIEAAEVLPAARESAAAEIEAIAGWNASGRQPQKTGFVRPLARPVAVELGGGAPAALAGEASRGLLQSSPEGLAEGSFTWVTRVEAAESSRLRLRLRSVELPEGTEMTVYNADGEAVRFGLELLGPGGELWTPSVAGPAIFLEIHSSDPAARHRFEIDAVSERFELDGAGRPITSVATKVLGGDTSCLLSSACITNGTLLDVASYRAAVAHINFLKDGDEYICSASLLNDRDTSGFIPYALTANHCFSSQASASSLEAYWDYHPATCGGAVPSLASRPRTNGSALLASSAGTDFTFLRLNSAPAGANGRSFLGWNASAVANNANVYGLHHPLGQAQSYTRSLVDRTPASVCSGASTTNYLYVQTQDGATFGGSSGSPITNANLQVVGQLLGGCGPNNDDPCNPGLSDYDVFGAFAVTHGAVTTWLDATGGLPCVDGPNTLCLLNKRFKVEATYRTAQGQTGAGRAVRLTEETGYFWFFNQSNIEAVFKLLNACTPALGNRFWVFAGGLTDVEVTTTVTDTTSGAVKTYFNPLGTPFQPIADTGAFATCP